MGRERDGCGVNDSGLPEACLSLCMRREVEPCRETKLLHFITNSGDDDDGDCWFNGL